MQIRREEGGYPPERETAPGGGAGGRVPEDPRRLRPAGPHQPGAAEEGAVSQLRLYGQTCHPAVFPLALTFSPPDISQSASLLQRWERMDWVEQMAGITSDHCVLLRLAQTKPQNLS